MIRLLMMILPALLPRWISSLFGPALPDAAEYAPDHLPELPATRGPAALPDAPVYSKPVIEVEVPGLDETRSLQRDSITKKLGELQKRGLASADIAGL